MKDGCCSIILGKVDVLTTIHNGQKSAKFGPKSAKIGETLGTLSRDPSEQHLLMDFFDYLKKTFSADSGRTGRARANLRPFLDFG